MMRLVSFSLGYCPHLSCLDSCLTCVMVFTGLIQSKDIPRELISELKIRQTNSTITPNTAMNTHELLPSLFQSGDIVKARVARVDVSLNTLELTMSPFEAEDDSIYNPSHANRVRTNYYEVKETIDPLSNLLWWHGEKFHPHPLINASDTQQSKKQKLQSIDDEDEDTNDLDREVDWLSDTDEINDRNWRRLFILDAAADNVDFESKAHKDQEDSIRREIGSLADLDYPTGYIVDERYAHLFDDFNQPIYKAITPIPEDVLDDLNGTYFAKEYRMNRTAVPRPNKPFSFASYWGPIVEQMEADLKKSRDDSLRRRLPRRTPSDNIDPMLLTADDLLTIADAVEDASEVTSDDSESSIAETMDEAEPSVSTSDEIESQ
jgi:hypothetical protein